MSVAVPRGISFEQKDGVLNVKRNPTIIGPCTVWRARCG
jgi:hypothetical protein